MEETLLLLFLFIGVMLMCAVAVSGLIGFFRTGVPYVQTTEADARALFSAANLRQGQLFYELGSGAGRVVFLAEGYGAVRATGFELIVWAHVFALVRKRMRRSRARFVRSDFFRHSWSDVDVLYGYLFPHIMPKVEQKFLAEAKPGTVFISCAFPFPHLEPQRIVLLSGSRSGYIYKK